MFKGHEVRLQLVRETAAEYLSPTKITGPIDIQNLVGEIGFADQERFVIVFLDVQHNVLGVQTVSIGTDSRANVYPKEIFKTALLTNSQSIILVHNHPSGNCIPSPDDFNLTKKLMQGADLLGIIILDHVILSHKSIFSFQENGIMPIIN